MNKLMQWLLLPLVGFCGGASAASIMGVEQPQLITSQGQTLHLNSYGIRSKWLMNIYTAALYLEKEQLQPSANWAVYADSPMALRLVVLRDDLNSQRMIAATRQGFEFSNGPQPLLQEELNQLLGLYQDTVKKGDIFTLSYHPNIGLQAFKNNVLKSTINSLVFKQAIYTMWLGEKPIQSSLKNSLLGKQ